MTTIIHARDESALENGSCYVQRVGKKSSTYSHYMNGDFVGWVQVVPGDLKVWSLKDAKKHLPKCMGGRGRC